MSTSLLPQTAATSSVPAASAGWLDRPAPRERSALTGFTPTLLAVELRRLLRNRRTAIFAIVMPLVMYLAFGANASYSKEILPHGNVAGLIMTSMALYGAMTAATVGGAVVAIERTTGWTRQLRITPVTPVAYVAAKVLVSMVLGGLGVLVVYLAGALTGAQLDPAVWAETAALLWVGSSVFAAYGLFIGYVVPGENAMQLAGPMLAMIGFFSGMFGPLEDGSTLDLIGRFTPGYGLAHLVHLPIIGGGVQWSWIVNLLAWIAIFVGGSAWAMRRDTKRV